MGAAGEDVSVTDLLSLPPDLPVPTDDGAAAHLVGSSLPDIALASTAGSTVSLAERPGAIVVYCYPRTARPDEPIPAAWNAVPGARGCTAEACSFRDHHAQLRAAGATAVFGVSTQTRAEQAEAARRLNLPFALLSDADFGLADSLRLPTFEFEGRRLLKRLTLIVVNGRITRVFYPVFPPDRHPAEVLGYLQERSRGRLGDAAPEDAA